MPDGFLWRDTFVSSIHLKSPFGAKRTYLQLEIPKWQQVLLSRTNSVITEKQFVDAPASNRWLTSRDTCILSTHLNTLTWNKMNLSPP
jgi:hypothetical protein